MSNSIEVTFPELCSFLDTYPDVESLTSVSLAGRNVVTTVRGSTVLVIDIVDPVDWQFYLVKYFSRERSRSPIKPSVMSSSEGWAYAPISTPWQMCGSSSTRLATTLPTAIQIMGGTVVVENAIGGDSISFLIEHPQAGVVGSYLQNWLLPVGNSSTIIREAAKELPAGLSIVALYNQNSQDTRAAGNYTYFGVNYTMYAKETRK